MSHFYGEIQGNRGLASRQGTKNSGIWAHIRGWNVGVKINGVHTQKTDIAPENDTFKIDITKGSNNPFSVYSLEVIKRNNHIIIYFPDGTSKEFTF